jgi:NAD(P)-dependent dehydrogenase (short-subunit alcohol dehydrogenase family)
MTGRDIAVIVGLVMCCLAFAALSIVLLQVLSALRELRTDLDLFESHVLPLMADLRDATDETREVVDEAREDLERFDRVLGSAEVVSTALADTSRVARTVITSPLIKTVAVVRGVSRGLRKFSTSTPTQALQHKTRRRRKSGR